MSLRVAGPGDAPIPPRTIEEAAEAGDQLALLEALRRRLAVACQDEKTPPRDLAALSRRLIEVDRDIKALRMREAEEAADARTSRSDAFDASAI